MNSKKEYIPSNWEEELTHNGHFKGQVVLCDTLKKAINESNWEYIDNYFQKETSPQGIIYKYLQNCTNFNSIEFIISLRDAENDWEEDGIWHDDGSRVLAFSLGLNKDVSSISGGHLHLRKKGSIEETIIPPFSFGEIIVFQTGINGYEHKIHQVIKGKRLIIAGWCS